MGNKEIFCRVYGRVQMVLFRDFVCRNARSLGLPGYVRNAEDGSVEFLAQGSKKNLETLIELARKGPMLARVSRVDVEWRTPTGAFDEFVITQQRLSMADNAPQCIGIIIDGNRRWAKEHGLPKLEGHRRGFGLVTRCIRWVRDREIPHMAVYVFSTENWNRGAEEVSYLMTLFQQMAEKELMQLKDEGVRLRFIGVLEMLPENVRRAVGNLERETAGNTKLTVWVCMSYGARAEIVAAAKELATSGDEITERSLRKHFWSAEMPDPDLIIRTGGEKRLSNFLLWQAAYSEFFFIDPYWPAFSEQELDRVLAEYATRERRIGR